MANEITVYSGLTINKRNSAGTAIVLQYQSQPVTFKADIDGSSGPYVGSVIVQRTYTIIDLSRVATPGMARIMNQDGEDFVEVGIWSPAAGDFFPMIELLKGESFVMRLSRFIGQGLMPGTGTGTSDLNTNYLAAKATGDAPCRVLFEVFPR